MKENTIQIVFALDKNFIQHCAACLASVFQNTPNANFCIHVISEDALSKELERLKKFVISHGHDFLFYHFDKKDIQSFKISLHITHATYYRLYIPQLIVNSKKVIYLDSDIIALGSLENLWNFNLKNKILAATYPEGQDHFNAGVLVINLERWRAEKITEKCADWIIQNNEILQFWDQDALNNVLSKEAITPLDKKWNWTENKPISLDCEVHLIHFIGTHKPWNFYCEHPLKGEYFKYLRLTPWRNYKLLQETRWYQWKQKIKALATYFVK